MTPGNLGIGLLLVGGALILSGSSSTDMGPLWDPVSEQRLKGLHPDVAKKVRQLVNRAERKLGIRLRITSGYRSWVEQNRLFDQGGLTNARGGQSWHNYGLAADVVPMTPSGQPVWNDVKLWNQIGKLGKQLGFKWGGEFKSIYDPGHFEMDLGKPMSYWLDQYGQGNLTYILDAL